MKILFVYTDINTMGQGEKTYHLGIGMISAVLKQNNHQTDLVCIYGKLNASLLLSKINTYQPEIIAFTSDTTQFLHVKQLINSVRKLNIFTILGGVHSSLCPSCLEQTPGLDAICLGEGEYSMLDLANNFDKSQKRYEVRNLWFKTNDRIIKNRLRPFIDNLDELPFADRDIFNFQNIIDSDYGRVPFMLSRGCPYACTYCASPSMGKLQEGRYVRFMSVDRTIKELKSIKEKYKFKSIFFADDIFTLDKNYVNEFSKRYKEEIGIPFEVNSRVEASSYEIFRILKDSGCFKVHIGIESGEEEFRKKVLHRKMSNEQILNAFGSAKKAGLQTKSYNIVGFPYETSKIHEATVEINRKINPDGHVCYIFQPYPGTALYDVCTKEGFINSFAWNNNSTISRRSSILNMPQFKAKDICRAHKNFSYKILKDKSLKKALIYKVYYSRYGEALLRILSPFKNKLRNIALRS